MKRTLIILVFIALIGGLSKGQSPSARPDAKPNAKSQTAKAAMPTVEQVLDRHVQAIGGKEAILKLSSRTMSGTISMAVINVTAPFETYQKAPNLMGRIINLPNYGTVQTGYDGVVAWEKDPESGVRLEKGAELAATKRDAEFYRDIKLKELFVKMILKGTENIGDRTAYVIEATPDEGYPEQLYFDTETGLLVRQDEVEEDAEGKSLTEFYYEDYRTVDGVKIPFVLRTISSTTGTAIIKLTEVKHNAPIDDIKFKKPIIR